MIHHLIIKCTIIVTIVSHTWPLAIYLFRSRETSVQNFTAFTIIYSHLEVIIYHIKWTTRYVLGFGVRAERGIPLLIQEPKQDRQPARPRSMKSMEPRPCNFNDSSICIIPFSIRYKHHNPRHGRR